jgi:hypothetical protein
VAIEKKKVESEEIRVSKTFSHFLIMHDLEVFKHALMFIEVALLEEYEGVACDKRMY